MKAIFLRSAESKNLKYTQYIGDGDSASFKKISEAKPYGQEIDIEKLKSVRHVQKRCRTRLRKIINVKGKKLDDGKDTVEEAVYSAVAYFTDGASAVVKLFQCLGIEGHYTLRARKANDTERIAKSTYKSLEYSKKR
ncbi:hypothetical protein RRG08_037917 [Elysia crispata]|uniref:Mutator-like transposase domain-containing protein n=1 Tax=Elysia crispata TaxID=231223 RepID=A0AAE1B9X7_9GAST|nr:hypothetical protein RRG08_037917 [Elysia crispata]